MSQATIFTIFGASGDLAKLKIFPAIYELASQQSLPEDFAVVGFARTRKSREEFQNEFSSSVRENFRGKLQEDLLNQLLDKVYYFAGKYDDSENFLEYRNFLVNLTAAENTLSHSYHIAYFSVPPSVFEPILENLAQAFAETKDNLRLVIEKPFGGDQKSAKKLYHFIAQRYQDNQIYLLDHYLGKQSVREILNLRRQNELLSSIIRPESIANIQISVLESIGVENRLGYFDSIGTIKDMIQSHLLNLLALLLMPLPVLATSDNLHKEKLNLLTSLLLAPDETNLSLGQYQEYKTHAQFTKQSETETFAAVRLFLNRLDWYNVPIYLRTGKKLKTKSTYVVIELKQALFQDPRDQPNRVIFELGPSPSIHFELSGQDLTPIEAKGSYACDTCFSEHASLFLEVMRGDKTHFLSFLEVLSSWSLVEQILEEAKQTKLETYPSGQSGPQSQHELTKQDNFEWYEL